MLNVLGGHTLKLDKPGCIRDSSIPKFFFSHRVIGHWNRPSLDQEMVDAPSCNASKERLGKLKQTRRVGFFVD